MNDIVVKSHKKYILALEKELFDKQSKLMYYAEVRTVAKSLPL